MAAVAFKGKFAENTQPERLVHAAIIDPNDIHVCKTANGKDWLLGSGSYGMVSPIFCYTFPCPLVLVHLLMCLCLPAVYTAFAPAWSLP